MASNPWKEVRGHKNWWQRDLLGGRIKYLFVSPNVMGTQSRFFIVKAKSSPKPKYKYEAFNSKARHNGEAMGMGSFDNLKEAMDLCERFAEKYEMVI